jgi:hypothetical protein
MAGLWAFGTLFQRGDGNTPEAFVTVANVGNVDGLDLKRNTENVTAHDSPEGWEEHRGTTKSGGEVSLELNYKPSDHDMFMADLDDNDPRTYRIVVPSTPSVTWTFKAVMTGFKQQFPHDGKMAGTFTFTVSGKPTYV